MLNKDYQAPLWKRTFAYVIDSLIINLIIILPFQELLMTEDTADFTSLYNYFMNNPESLAMYTLLAILLVILITLYWSLLEYFTSQTPGKMLFKLSVVSIKGKLRFSQCLIRSLSKFSLALLILDSLKIIIKNSNQRYLEKISNTKVVAHDPEVI